MKINIKLATLEDTYEIVKHFYYQNEKELFETKKYLYGYYPQLENISKNLTTKEKDEIIYNAVKEKYNEELLNASEKVKHFNEIWEKYNDAFINSLSKYLNTSWHDFKNEIIGYVAPVPIFPRYIDKLTFYFSKNISDEKFIEVVAHECTHFLWFKKISEINKNEYNKYTQDEWEYSELVTDPVLNSKELNDVLHINEKAYDYFYDLEYNNESVMNHIKKIYNKNISIEEKIVEGFEYYLSAKKMNK